jgi:phytoene dehydrogenase-like protein
VPSVRTKTELLAALEASRDEVVGGLDGLDLSAGVYEGGWNGRQLLAHIASMEWTYPRILELPEATDEEAARPRDTSVTVDDYNRRQVEKRDGATVDELIEEFVRNRTRTIEAVAAYPEDEFERRVRSAGGTVGSLADVLWFVAVDHVRGHLADLRGT